MAAPLQLSTHVTTLVRNLLKLRSIRSRFGPRLSSSDSTSHGSDSQESAAAPEETFGPQDSDEPKPKLTGFARAFAQHSTAVHQQGDFHEIAATQQEETVPKSFATLLRNSPHVHIGNAKGQLVIGKIFHIVEDDLYIDFGGKFHCVCKKPEKDAEKFHRGSKVLLRLKDTELTDHFIGAARDLSLLEADADLLGLAKPEK